VISQDTWSGFIDQTVTPNFPEGLTSWSASGQWRMADGAIVREPSYVLQLTHAASEERDQAVTRIMDQYKNRYRQEAVMRVRSTACVSF
jgi:nitrous oxide reductase